MKPSIHRRSRRLAALACAAALSLAGCASAPKPSTSDVARQRIAVFSIAAGEMHHYHAGMTRLDSFATRNDITAWRMDDVLVERTANAVRSVTGADVVIPAIDRAVFDRVYEKSLAATLLLGPPPVDWSRVTEDLTRMAADNRADWVIALVRVQNTAYRGFGTFTSLSATDNRGAYASIAVHLLDGATGERIGEAWVTQEQSRNFFHPLPYPRGLPWAIVPKNLSTKTPQDMTAGEQAQLRDVFLQLASAQAIGDGVARLFDAPRRYVATGADPKIERQAAPRTAAGASTPQPAAAMAVAMRGATLRGRPERDAPIVMTLAAGAPLDLVSSLQNSAGNWWYVEAGDRSGWIAEADVQRR